MLKEKHGVTNPNYIMEKKCNVYFSKFLSLKVIGGVFLAVQWLRFYIPKAGGASSIPGQGTKFPHAVGHGQNFFFFELLDAPLYIK